MQQVAFEADLAELLGEADGRLLDADAVLRCWSQAVLNVRGTILALPLPEAQRFAILDAITDIPPSAYAKTAPESAAERDAHETATESIRGNPGP